MPKYPGISPYDNEKGTLGTAKKRWEKLYVKEIVSDTVNGINASIENLATTATNSVSAAVSAKNDAVSAKNAAEAAQTAAETAAAGIQSVVETDVDNTLSIAGVAADAKVTGDWLRDIAKPVTLNTSLPATAVANEFMKVTTDSEGRVLYGVKRDGTFTWQKGVPQHVIDACNPTIENPEYLYVMLDTQGHIILSVKRDGSFTWAKGVPLWLKERIGEYVSNNEFAFLITDNNKRMLFGIREDGSVDWQKGIPLHLKKYIDDSVVAPLSPLSGKRWVVIGDSVTAHASNPKKYWGYIADETGVIPIDKAVSGGGFKVRSSSSGMNYLDSIATLNPDDFDFATIAGSSNDSVGSSPLGNITDKTTDTVFGCVNLAIEAYMDLAWDKPLGMVTPNIVKYLYERNDGWEEEYSDGIIKIAQKQGIPILDMFRECGVRPWETRFREKFYISVTDGTHLNSLGHETFIAPKFKEFILKLVW